MKIQEVMKLQRKSLISIALILISGLLPTDNVYLNLEDTIQALKDYSQAINIVPDDDLFYNQR